MPPEDTQNDQPASPDPTGNATWENRFKGLQTAHNKARDEWTASTAGLQATVATMTSELLETRQRVDAFAKTAEQLKAERDKLAQERDEAKTAAATAAKASDRAQRLMRYPNLLGFESDGLLRTDLEGDALDQYLKGFSVKIGSVGEKAIDSELVGVVPGGVSARATDPQSKEALEQQLSSLLQKASMSNDPADWNAYYESWGQYVKTLK
jgi:hypothetical protein